jgi:hypothetical protein
LLFLKKNLIRLNQYRERAAERGVSGWQALLVEMPFLASLRAYRKLAMASYRTADRMRWQDKRTQSFLTHHTAADGKYFYIIAVPTMLHLLIPAVRLVESEVRIIFVVNGLSRRELHLLSKVYPRAPLLRLPTLPRSSWAHGTVISLLLRTSPRDFGILDHDCFLFDVSIFRQLEFTDNEYAISLTGWRNDVTGLLFPGTHFLYLRVAPLRRLMRQYAVDANLYKRLPRSTSSALSALGLSIENPPKEYQNFFDSFLLLSALAMHQGLTARLLKPAQNSFTHVGSTSMGSQLTKLPVHQYLNARFIARLEDEDIVKEYLSHGLASVGSAARYRSFLEPKTAEQIDALIARVDRHVSAHRHQSVSGKG